MQDGLTKLRKQLTIETGPSAAELAAQKAESPAADAAAADTLNEEAAGENEVVRRFFQVSRTAIHLVVQLLLSCHSMQR